MRSLFLVLVLLCAGNTFSQVTEKYASPQAGFYRAEDLFAKEQYSAARQEFRSFLDTYEGSKNDPYVQKALYYEGLSALELFNNDAIDLLENFLREYPESAYRNATLFKIGQYYYQKKDYDKALEYYAKVRKSDLEKDQLDEYYFKVGYSYFHEKKYGDAKASFFEVKESTSQYGAPALYYFSHICYMDSSYQIALEGFEKLVSDPRFKPVVPYYITQIYHLQGRYEDVVKFAPNYIDSMKPNEKVDMNHLLGDAYFRLGKYDEAVPHLEYYNQKANTTRDDDYELALAYSKSSDCAKAVKYFDKVARVADTLGQIALYHAAECYVTLNQLPFAKTAFEAASKIDKDAVIQEDALFNFAILSYKLDINSYDETVDAFELYLSKYPNSSRKNTVYQYLVNVYTSTRNYQKALESLDRLPNKDIKLKTAYQLIAFNHGVELFLKNEYDAALTAFELVKKYPVSDVISAKAVFWSADAHFRKGAIEKAIQMYDQFLAMPATFATGLRYDANYNKGYAYLATKKKEDVAKAKDNFQAYVGSTTAEKKKKADAHMRLADTYFMLKDDKLAIANYKAALDLKQGSEDRALFYMSRSYGYQNNKDEKLKCLQDIVNNYPKSSYVQVAVYEVAKTYFSAGNLDKAERYFKQIITDYPNSSYVKDAHHNLGLVAYQKGNYNEAEKQYKFVLDNFQINDSICKREIYALADVYRKQGFISKIESLPSLYSCADSLTNQVESEYFSKAMKSYTDSNFVAALNDFNFYLNKYPSGKFRTESLYYKADVLYRQNKEAEAIEVYLQLLEGENSDYTELAAMRTARYYYNSEQFVDALKYYERLEKVATRPDFIVNMQIGLMRCHFIVENWASALEYSKKVLAGQPNATIRLEGEYVKGITSAKTDQFAQAVPSLEYVVKNTTKEWASECKYNLAWVAFKQNDLTKTDVLIRELQKMKPKYDYWLAKGLILQTQVLIKQNNLFQAEKTIKSVIDYYPVKDDGIIDEASEWYDEVMRLKSQPKSITAPDAGTVIDVENNIGN